MIFQGAAQAPHAFLGPDPVAAPADVKDAQLLFVPRRRADVSTQPIGLFLALDGVGGETLTGDLYALDESTSPPVDDTQVSAAELGARRFYRVAAALVLTNGILLPVNITWPCFPCGTLYFRQTADTIAVGQTRSLRAAGV